MSSLVEEWRPVVGYEGLYEVSNLGRVRSLDRYVRQYNASAGRYVDRFFPGKILKLVTNCYGYRIVSLKDKEHNQKEGKVHRLVAQAFIPNQENKPLIDHIIPIRDGGTDEVTNLRWCTNKENHNNERTRAFYKTLQNGRQLNRPDQSKKVFQYLGDKFISEYDSVSEAERQLNVCKSLVSRSVRQGNKINNFNFYYSRMESNFHTWTDEDIKLVERFIEVRDRGYYVDSQLLTDVHNRVLHTNLKNSTCGSCNRQRVATLEQALNKFKSLQQKAVEPVSEPEVNDVKAEEEKPVKTKRKGK